MLLVLFLAGIASASLSEDFNKNPDLYYRILFKHADKTFKALGLILGFFILVEAGIHEPPGPRTVRSDLVLDFLIFVGPGPVRSEIF